MLRNLVILAGLILQTSCELVLLKKGEDAYCVSRNDQDKALAWTVKMDEHVNLCISYNVTGEWSKWIPQNGIFQHLNCNPMLSEKCDGWANFDKWTKKIVTWTDDYGLVLDQRWNDFPLHIGLKNTPKVMELPSKNLSKFYVNLSVLSKTCVRLIFFNNTRTPPDPEMSENKYVFDVDCKKSGADNKPLRLLTKSRHSSSTESRGKNGSSFLNQGDSWTNIKMVYEMGVTRRASWMINGESFTISNASTNIVTHFAIRAQSNTFYWRHHSDYRIVEMNDINSPLEATIVANHVRDRELCISISYLGQGNLTLLSDGGNIATSVILSNNKSWTTFRYVFYLTSGKEYKLSIHPSLNNLGNINKFSLGYIRVCNEKEYKVDKYKEYENNKVKACGLLSETFIRTNRYKQHDSDPFVFSCEKGHFGANCDMKCSDIDELSDCRSVIACSSTSCSCLPGYHGVNCSHECGENKYGETCTLDCGKCDKGKQCFHANGSCPGNMCAAGFSGTLCNKPCSDGTYGKNCANHCSKNCNDPLKCNSVDGNCTGGCKSEEYRPPTCQQKRAKVVEITQTENGNESVEFQVKIDVDDVKHLKSYQVQVRDKQDQPTFQNHALGLWNGTEKLLKCKVEKLKPKTTYYTRVLLIETDDKYNDKLVTINFTTLCKPAAVKEDFVINRDNDSKPIEIQLVGQTDEHDCKLDDYDIYLNGVNFTNRITHTEQLKLENLQNVFDDINVIKIEQKFNPKINFEIYKNEKIIPMEEITEDITILPQVNTTPSPLLENNSMLQISTSVLCTALVTISISIVVIMIMKKKFQGNVTNSIELSHPISVSNPVSFATNPISTSNPTSENPVPEVEEVVYDEIDLRKAVEVPAPEVNQYDVPTDNSRSEPVHYDVVQEPQPMLPWIKTLQDNRLSGTVQHTVDEGGYEVPIALSNVAESSK